eukprot:s1658_g12.t1
MHGNASCKQQGRWKNLPLFLKISEGYQQMVNTPWAKEVYPNPQARHGRRALISGCFCRCSLTAPRARGLALESTVQNEGCPYNDGSPCRTSRERRCQILEHECASSVPP